MKFIKKVIKNNTRPIANKDEKCKPPFTVSPISAAIVAVMVLTGCSQEKTILGEFPVIIRTVIVSPTILPKPSMIDATIPELAAGITTLYVVSHFVAPSAREAWRYFVGTAFIASSEIEIIVGRLINASIIDPANAVSPIGRLNNLFIAGTTSCKPMKPITTEGMVASISIMGFKVSLTAFGASSPIYIADPIPRGRAMTIAPTVTRMEPVKSGNNPNFSVDVGAHLVPIKKSKIGYSTKNFNELYTRNIRIIASTRMDNIPLKKINLAIRIFLKFLNLDFNLLN
jgi:hypothetical protein